MPSTALTLAQAAKLVGCRTSALKRAIAAGRLTATRQADGSYTIEAGELDRRRAQWDLPARDRRRRTDRTPDGEPLKV